MDIKSKKNKTPNKHTISNSSAIFKPSKPIKQSKDKKTNSQPTKSLKSGFSKGVKFQKKYPSTNQVNLTHINVKNSNINYFKTDNVIQRESDKQNQMCQEELKVIKFFEVISNLNIKNKNNSKSSPGLDKFKSSSNSKIKGQSYCFNQQQIKTRNLFRFLNTHKKKTSKRSNSFNGVITIQTTIKFL